MITKEKGVWLVEVGEYSDYHVVGVFSSEANAEVIAKLADAQGRDHVRVTHYPLDPGLAEINAGLSQYLIHMRRDGTVERVEAEENITRDLIGSSYGIWHRSTIPPHQKAGVEDCLTATVWARNDKHAIKIVNDHRAQMIANDEWPAAREENEP